MIKMPTLKIILKKIAFGVSLFLPDRLSWKLLAQNGEYLFHRSPGWRHNNEEEYQRTNRTQLENLGFSPNQYSKKTILDIGAGSRLRTLFFDDAEIYVIEPLADRFLKLDWSDIGSAKKIWSTPAEMLISELIGQVDFVFSMNALDHGYNFDLALSNIVKYVKKGGNIFLSFDEHIGQKDVMHPLELTEKSSRTLFEYLGLQVVHFEEYSSEHTIAQSHQHRTLRFWLIKV